MAKERLNMIDLMNEAWEDRFQYTSDTYKDYCKNLFSHAFVTIDNGYAEYCEKNNIKNEEYVFIMFQRIIISFMLTDGDFNQEEYDAYCTFCDYADFKPLTPQRCREIFNSMDNNDLAKFIRMLIDLREIVNPEDWRYMILGFCYLCLMGDKAMDENEYYILRCFFEKGFDYAPVDWAAFKREWE